LGRGPHSPGKQTEPPRSARGLRSGWWVEMARCQPITPTALGGTGLTTAARSTPCAGAAGARRSRGGGGRRIRGRSRDLVRDLGHRRGGLVGLRGSLVRLRGRGGRITIGRRPVVVIAGGRGVAAAGLRGVAAPLAAVPASPEEPRRRGQRGQYDDLVHWENP